MIDVESFVGEGHGYQKQGNRRRLHRRARLPLVFATRSGSGEPCTSASARAPPARGRGATRFVQELIARVRRAGASGEILVRAASAFWNKKVMAYLDRHGCRYSISVNPKKPVLGRIAAIPEDAPASGHSPPPSDPFQPSSRCHWFAGCPALPASGPRGASARLTDPPTRAAQTPEADPQPFTPLPPATASPPDGETVDPG